MADVSRYLEDILAAVYGEEVRQSIHDAIQAINQEAVKAALDASIGNLSFRKNQKGQEWKLHEKCSYDFMRQSRGSSAAAG